MNCKIKFSRENNPRTTPMVVETDFELWNYLLQGCSKKPRHRYSRMEAFYDLLTRHRLMMLNGNDDDFIDASLQDLANAWSWDRGAVRRFVEALSDMEAVTLDTDYSRNNKTIIRLKNVSGLSPVKVAHPSATTYNNASSDDSNIKGRPPITQEGYGARQDDS